MEWDPKQQKAIERSFPFVEISEIAERQSWRKDVYQPVYYIHKQQAKSPIDIDIIIVGRKLAWIEPSPEVPVDLFSECVEETSEIAEAFNQASKKLSRSDITVIMMARLITTLSRARDLEKILSYLSSAEREMGAVVERIWKRQNPRDVLVEERQMRLF